MLYSELKLTDSKSIMLATNAFFSGLVGLTQKDENVNKFFQYKFPYVMVICATVRNAHTKKQLYLVCEKTKLQLKHVYSKFFSSFCFQTFEYQ